MKHLVCLLVSYDGSLPFRRILKSDHLFLRLDCSLTNGVVDYKIYHHLLIY